MSKFTITIRDLAADDPRGNITVAASFDPVITPDQKSGRIPLTPAQAIGSNVVGFVQNMLNTPVPVEQPPATDVIELAPAGDGVLAVKEGGQ
jgi:hypothetical protein